MALLFFVFQRKLRLDVSSESSAYLNPLLGRGFTCKIKPYFLGKMKVKIKILTAANFFAP